MSYYASAPAPPKRDAVVAAARALLQASSDIIAPAGVGSASQVYERRPTDAPTMLIVVRERKDMGGPRTTQSRRQVVVIQVMSECAEHLAKDYSDIKTWHHQVQTAAFSALQGATLTLTDATEVLPLERIGEPQVAYDAATETYYATSEYQAVIDP